MSQDEENQDKKKPQPEQKHDGKANGEKLAIVHLDKTHHPSNPLQRFLNKHVELILLESDAEAMSFNPKGGGFVCCR